MPHFVIICIDRKNHAQLRAGARSEHLNYIETASEILLVGPLLDEEDRVIGSLYMVEADDRDKARAFIDADPFTKVGLFETIEVNRFRTHLGKLIRPDLKG